MRFEVSNSEKTVGAPATGGFLRSGLPLQRVGQAACLFGATDWKPVPLCGQSRGLSSRCEILESQWLSMNRPLTPSLSPSDGERVAGGRVRGGSWSQCMRKNERGLSMNRWAALQNSASPEAKFCEGPSRPVHGPDSRSNFGGSPCP